MADMKAVKRALSAAMALVDSADVQGLRAMRGGPMSVEVEMGGGKGEGEGEGSEECPECAAGNCPNPDHMSDDDAKGMAAMYGDT